MSSGVRFPKVVSVLLAIAIFQSSFATPVFAQKGSDLLGGLLQELVRSQIERREQKQRAGRPNLQPTQPFPTQPRPRTNRPAPQPQPRTVVIPQKMRTAQGYFTSFATECDRLAFQLNQQSRTVPGVRTHLDKVLRLKARSALLQQRYSQPAQNHVIIDDIHELDREWRTASYQLSQLNLNSTCKQSITKLDGLNRQCCELYNVAPEVDLRAVARLADSLADEFHHLERDVSVELRGNPNAQQFVFSLRRLAKRTELFADAVSDRSSYDVIVNQFKPLVAEWNPIARSMAGFNDRHINRTVDAAHGMIRNLHEQLWLPVGLNRERLTLLGAATRQQLKEMQDFLPLSLLVDLQDGPQILTSAKTVRDASVHMCGCLEGNDSIEDLVADWQVLDKSWREFDHYTETVDAPQLRILREEIDTHINDMREGLGIQLVFDRRAVVLAAAELDGLAEQAQYHLQQWSRRPGSNVDQGMMRAASRIIQDCHHLHEECAGRESREHLARDCDKLVTAWTKLRPQLAACQTVDQVALRRISDQATVKLIQLQTMLGD